MLAAVERLDARTGEAAAADVAAADSAALFFFLLLFERTSIAATAGDDTTGDTSKCGDWSEPRLESGTAAV